MSEPDFLTVEQVEWLHRVAIDRFGAEEFQSLRVAERLPNHAHTRAA
jgi:hypothetical protein